MRLVAAVAALGWLIWLPQCLRAFQLRGTVAVEAPRSLQARASGSRGVRGFWGRARTRRSAQHVEGVQRLARTLHATALHGASSSSTPADWNGGEACWEKTPGHTVSRKHRVFGGGGGGQRAEARELLWTCLEERGLELVPCGHDCMGAIVECVHAARIKGLGLDAPDANRTLRRLWADVLLYTSSSHASLSPSPSRPPAKLGAWPDDDELDACAQACSPQIDQ